MLDKVKAVITAHHKRTAGKTGITNIAIALKLDCSISDLKPILNQLYVDEFIKIREGINHKLIFVYSK